MMQINPIPTLGSYGGMLSMSSLMGAAALMTQSDDPKAATSWAEHFQGNYRLMTPEEKAEAAARLARRYSAQYRKKVTVDPPPRRRPASSWAMR
jgi:hypothetical protein